MAYQSTRTFFRLSNYHPKASWLLRYIYIYIYFLGQGLFKSEAITYFTVLYSITVYSITHLSFLAYTFAPQADHEALVSYTW